jgi:phosphoribosylformylglycinamidine synthase PurS subunit
VKRRFEVVIHLKEGLADPQGKAIQDALPALGWTNVSDVRVGKSITVELESADGNSADEQIAEMAHRILSNPVIEEFWVRELEERS